MLSRHFYALDLPAFVPDPSLSLQEGLTSRPPNPGDREPLAELMLSAYSGTIDDDGGIMEDAVVEVDNFFRGEYGDPLLDSSRLAIDDEGRYVSAVLVSRWGRQDLPLVAFIMTDPARQGKGIGLSLILQSAASLKEAGERAVRAVITDGNFPSERLFTSAGFRKIETK